MSVTSRETRKLWPSEPYKTATTKPLTLVRQTELLSLLSVHHERTMNNLGITLMLLCIVCGVLGGRRYIAIPVDGIEGIDVIEVNPLTSSRVTRQTEAYVPSVHQDDPREQRSERSATHVLDYVDFGGQTGSNGAFSWYADYPAHHL